MQQTSCEWDKIVREMVPTEIDYKVRNFWMRNFMMREVDQRSGLQLEKSEDFDNFIIRERQLLSTVQEAKWVKLETFSISWFPRRTPTVIL